MKKFFIYVSLLLTLLVVAAATLDLIYTLTYNYDTPRNKVMWVKQMKTKQKLDYIILGSSRANHHIDPVQINKKTNLYGVNLGVEAYGSFEMYLMLQEFLKSNTVNRVFVQVDELYLEAHPHKLSETGWLPYIREPSLYRQFRPFGSKYALYKYIPFYRFAVKDAKLGFRNVITSMVGKGQPYADNLGFHPQTGTLTIEKEYIASKPITERNIYIDKMIALCKRKNIQIDFFTAPIYKFEGDLSPLERYLPNYKDFKDTIKRRNLFADQIHLNAEGAAEFTGIFTTFFFNKSSYEASIKFE